MRFEKFLDEEHESSRLGPIVSSQLISLMTRLKSEKDIETKLNILGLMILVSTVPSLPDNIGMKLIR